MLETQQRLIELTDLPNRKLTFASNQFDERDRILPILTFHQTNEEGFIKIPHCKLERSSRHKLSVEAKSLASKLKNFSNQVDPKFLVLP